VCNNGRRHAAVAAAGGWLCRAGGATEWLMWWSPRPAASGKYIEDRIHDGAKVPLIWSPSPTPLRQQLAQQHPLLGGHVACIALPNATILFSGGFGPSHGVPLGDSKPTKGIMRTGPKSPAFFEPSFRSASEVHSRTSAETRLVSDIHSPTKNDHLSAAEIRLLERIVGHIKSIINERAHLN
jgi:hypothetical protein